MSEPIAVGYIEEVKADGNVEIALLEDEIIGIGVRLVVIDDGRPIAEIKIVSSEPGRTVGRQFQRFVSNEQLKRASTIGMAAMAGAIISPGVGGVIGALIGSALTYNKKPVIRAGMRVAHPVDPMPELEL